MVLTLEQQKSLLTGFISKAKPFVPTVKVEQVVAETVSTSPSPSSPSPVSPAPGPSALTSTVDPSFVGPPAPVPDPIPPQPGDPTFIGPPVPIPPQPGDPGFVGPVAFPFWYSTQVHVPESVRFLGLGEKYLRYGYERSPELFESLYKSRFEQLQPARKFEYGLRFGDIKKVPIGEWKYYEGGAEYLGFLSETEKQQKLKEYLGTKEWQTYISSPTGKVQLELTRESIARRGLGPLDIVTMVGVDVAKAERELARQRLFGKPETFEKKLWKGFDIQTRYKQLFKEGIIGGALAIPTLVETGLSYGFGTPTPLGKMQQEQFVSYTPSLFEAPFSEEARGRITEDPGRLSESIFKTGATFIGFKGGMGVISKSISGVKKITFKTYGAGYQYLPQSIKHQIVKASEFKKYGMQRNVAFVQRMKLKYVSPVQEKISGFKYDYSQVFKKYFPRIDTTIKKTAAFKVHGLARKQVFRERISYKLGDVKQKIVDIYPKHKITNLMKGIEERIPRLPKYDIAFGKQLKPSQQFSFESYARFTKQKIIKYPAEGTGLEGTKPFTRLTGFETKSVISKKFFKDWKVTKQDIIRYEDIDKVARDMLKNWKMTSPKIKIYKQIDLKLSAKPSVYLDRNISFYKDSLKGFKGFKLPIHKPMTLEEIYIKTSREAKKTFLSRKPTYLETQFRIEPVGKTKYLLTTKKGKLVVDKLEIAESMSKPSTPWFKPIKSEITIKDLKTQPVYKGQDPLLFLQEKPIIVTRGFTPQFQVGVRTTGGFRMPGGWAMATGGVSLSFLDFLEEGTQYVHPRWDRKTIDIPKVGLVVKPSTKTSMDKMVQPEIRTDVFKTSMLQPRSDISIRPDVKTGLDTDIRVIPVQIQTPVTEQVLQQQPIQVQLQIQKMKQRLIQKLEITPPKTPTPTRPIIILPPIPSDDIGRTTMVREPGQGYKVMVKDRYIYHGKPSKKQRFVKVSKTPLSEIDALALGAHSVDRSAAATFYIKPVRGIPRELDIDIPMYDAISYKFRTKTDGKLVERKTHRIDSQGEVEGISALGWIAKQPKKVMKQVKHKPEQISRMYTMKQVKPKKDSDLMDEMDKVFEKMNKVLRGGKRFGI